MRITPSFVFFWGDADHFSNFHPSPFQVGENTFFCNEQFIMYQKAMIFQDLQTADAILRERRPKAMKNLGRQVKNYDDELWASVREDVGFTGALAKYTQNPALRQQLLDTGQRELVEASPYDRIWGIGLGENDDRVLNKNQWRGQNILGQILMRVRDALNETQNAGR